MFQLCRGTPIHANPRRRFHFDLARRSAHDISVWQKVCFRRFLLILVGLAAVASILSASAQQEATKLKVVATFSILGDLARNVGGDRVDVTTLVGPNGDVHVYTPTTADAEAIRNAGLVIVNGLGLEGWLPRLVESSGGHATTVVATHGIVPRKVAAGEILSRDRGAGSLDPHAWQSVANAEIYVVNIRDAMVAADRANAATYKANTSAYLAKLETLDRDAVRTRAAVAEGIQVVARLQWGRQLDAMFGPEIRLTRRMHTQYQYDRNFLCAIESDVVAGFDLHVFFPALPFDEITSLLAALRFLLLPSKPAELIACAARARRPKGNASQIARRRYSHSQRIYIP